MDPKTTVGNRLANWARQMGFTLPDGSIPDDQYFHIATNTPERRRLFTLIMDKTKDRRYVRKVRHELSVASCNYVVPESTRKKKEQEKAIARVRTEMAHVESQIDQGLLKLDQQGNRIKAIEAARKELNRKIIFFHCIEHAQRESLDWYSEVNKTLVQLNTLPHTDKRTIMEAKMWLLKVEAETKLQWFNPALLESLCKRVQEGGAVLSFSLLKAAVPDSFMGIVQDVEHAKKTAESNLAHFNDVAPQLVEHPSIELCRERVSCAINEALLHFFRGQDIDNEVSKIISLDGFVNEDRKLADDIAELAVSYSGECDVVLEEDINLEERILELQLKAEEKKKSYDLLRTKVLELKACVDLNRKHALSLSQEVTDLSADISRSTRNNTGCWNEMSQKFNMLSRNHLKLLWHSPLKKIKAGLPSQPFEDSSEGNEKFWKDLRNRLTSRLECLSNNINPEVVLDEDAHKLKENWEKDVNNQLTKTIEKAEEIMAKLEEGEKTLNLLIEQPFGKMIPDSEKVENLTFGELEMQHKLSMRLNNNMSHID